LAATCSSGGAPVVAGGEASPASGSSLADSRAEARSKAEGALLTVEALPAGGWSATPTTSSPSAPRFIECPALAARHPAFAAAKDQVVVQGPEFERSAPPASLQELIAVFESPAAAAEALAALRDQGANDCIASLLGRQRSAAPAAPPDVEVTAWDVGSVGDDRVAFDLAVTASTAAGTQVFHVGIAFVRVGPALAVVTLFSPGALGDEQAGAVANAARSLGEAFGG
jgi:hypothetical protein